MLVSLLDFVFENKQKVLHSAVCVSSKLLECLCGIGILHKNLERFAFFLQELFNNWFISQHALHVHRDMKHVGSLESTKDE